MPVEIFKKLRDFFSENKFSYSLHFTDGSHYYHDFSKDSNSIIVYNDDTETMLIYYPNNNNTRSGVIASYSEVIKFEFYSYLNKQDAVRYLNKFKGGTDGVISDEQIKQLTEFINKK